MAEEHIQRVEALQSAATADTYAARNYGSGRSSADRKAQPIATGVLAYFPHAIAAVSSCSKKGNDKHNPGEPLHWAKEKSTDEADCIARHLTDALAEGPLTLNEDGVPHVVSLAWRALAFAERALTEDDRWKGLPK